MKNTKPSEHHKGVVLYSGGLDSTTLLYWLAGREVDVWPLLFRYGQQHARELIHAYRILAGLRHEAVKEIQLTDVFTNSLLTGQDWCSPIVSNRNMVMLSIAAAFAAGLGINRVYIGCNADDAKVFPDCKSSFIDLVNMALADAEVDVKVVAPFVGLTKRHVVKVARGLGVPIADTYSCYAGRERVCGKCLACKTRKAALAK